MECESFVARDIVLVEDLVEGKLHPFLSTSSLGKR